MRPPKDRMLRNAGVSFAGLAMLLGALLALAVAGGCATKGDLESLQQASRVQDDRLKALETSVGAEIQRLNGEIGRLLEQLRKADARAGGLADRTERLLGEQARLADDLEKANARIQAAQRQAARQGKNFTTLVRESEKELDAVRLMLADINKLMKTSIAQLPAKTKADRLFREAFFHMVSGQLDLAADRFAEFAVSFPGVARAPEAKYRRGQAFFLMRKYDHALVPFFDLVEKHPKHDLAVDGRWMIARSLEEIGDFTLAREFYAQLISENTIHKADATRRVFFINKLYPKLPGKPDANSATKGQKAGKSNS